MGFVESMTRTGEKLFLLDGMALIYRAHFAFIRSPRINSRGLNTSAVFGFANSLVQILRDHDPENIAVVFDTPEPTFRHELFPEYKAQREAMPEDIAAAIPLVDRLVEAFNIPILRCPGYEADDVIGTLATRAAAAGLVTYMVTPDKDYAQLVGDRVFMYKPARMGDGGEILGVPEVLEQWGVERVDQVVDILGLAGDASDNIPGVPGIGPKTAQKLVATYGSVEDLLANVDKLKGKQKEKVEANAEQALLSKTLATIALDAPVEIDLGSLRRGDLRRADLESLFAELEFRGLAEKLLGDGPAPAADETAEAGDTGAAGDLFADDGLATIADVPHEYELVADAEGRARLLAELLAHQSVCFDSETTDLDARRAEIVGLAFSVAPHTGRYVAFPPGPEAKRSVLEEFRPFFENETIEKVGHNLKYDLAVLRRHDMPVRGPLFDTMLAHQLVEPDQRHGMDALAAAYLHYAPVSITTLIGDDKEAQISMADVPAGAAADYAAEDADVTLQLRQALASIIDERNAEKVLRDVECPLIAVLVDMEREGVAVDIAALAEYSRELTETIERLAAEITEAAGTSFNIDSPKQLGQVLFDILKLVDKPKKTKTGQYATNEQVLSRLAPKHEIVRKVLEYRIARKLKSTYVDMLPQAVDADTGRIHTTYNQAVTATGRLQSQGPNLQNIPIRTEQGKEIRRAFVARGPEYLLLAADYSQIELRLMAELSRDEGLMEAFAKGIDIHQATAAKVHGVFLEMVTDEMRRRAKMVNFGIIYGISAFGLAERLDIPRGEAKDIIEQYFEQYPKVRQYMDDTVAFAQEHGYVETLVGRRRYIRDINSRNATIRAGAERNAINAPVQGTAADIIKIAMARVHDDLRRRELRTKMILQVHDELVFDMHRDEEKEVRAIVEAGMTSAIPLAVPMIVEMGVGENWLQAH